MKKTDVETGADGTLQQNTAQKNMNRFPYLMEITTRFPATI